MAAAYDAVIVGSGPNGLAAAIRLAQTGKHVLVVEGAASLGGGMRSSELTEPGYLHDECSSVHPMALASPFLSSLSLAVDWIQPPSPLAHVMPDGRAVLLERSVDETAAQFGVDAKRYRALMQPYVERFDELIPLLLAPLRIPSSPLLMARFGLTAIRSLTGLVKRFQTDEPAALLAGIAAHAIIPLDGAASGSFGLVLGLAGHAVGWPIPRGGSKAIATTLIAKLRMYGGEMQTGRWVTSIDELPSARAYLFDVAPRQLAAIAGDRLPQRYRDRLLKFRYGGGVFKLDWALSGPVPWKDPRCARSATVHLSGRASDVVEAERAVYGGRAVPEPYTLFGQPTLFDPERAPPGRHIAWAYCHVPAGSTEDMTAAVEAHVDRHAPGFRDLILARRITTPGDLEAHNPNYIGGDINVGMSDLRQLFFRPMAKLDPYATPAKDIFLCSSSTPPGGGVHGMCGYWAARSALANVFGE